MWPSEFIDIYVLLFLLGVTAGVFVVFAWVERLRRRRRRRGRSRRRSRSRSAS